MEIPEQHRGKFQLPQVKHKLIARREIDTERLFASKFTLLYAPAGFGKTCALIQTMAEHRSSLSWFSLREEDIDLQSFYASLADALSILEPSLRSKLEKILPSSGSEFFSEPGSMIQEQLGQAITYSMAPHTLDSYLVLDNFQLIPHGSPIQETLRYLLENTPPQLHFLIASRSKPDFAESNFSRSEHAYFVEAEQLRFSVEETCLLAHEYQLKNLNDRQLSTINAITNGRAATIAPLLQNFAGGFEDPLQFDKQQLYRLIFSEICASLSGNQLRLLLGAALAEEMNRDDLCALFGTAMADQLVTWLDDKGMLLDGSSDAHNADSTGLLIDDTAHPSERWHILQSLLASANHEKATNIVIDAQLFGEFRVAINGQVISAKDWKTKKISSIFKYFLVNKGRRMARGLLAEKFWPESDSALALASFRVALYELRKLLSHYLPDEKIIEEDKFGLYLSDRIEQHLDVIEFEALYKELRYHNPSAVRAQELVDRLLALYQGAFLANENYDDWIIEYRNYYSSIFTEISLGAADAAMQRLDTERAEALLHRLLTHEPYNEQANARLIALYEASGNIHQAQSWRKEFSKRYFEEFGEMPSLIVH